MKLQSIKSFPTAVPDKQHRSSAMGMSKCYSFMKCLLLFFNIVFLAVGMGVCALAGWALWAGAAEPPAVEQVEQVEQARAARAGLAAAGAWGAALAGGAGAGLAGAARHSAPLLAGSFALLALCGVAEAAAGWWGAQHTPELRRELAARLRHATMHEYGLQPASTHLIDAIQHGLECCGVEGARDWHESAWARARNPAPAAPSPAAPAPPAPAPAPAPLDLTVGAPPLHFAVPSSCCPEDSVTETCMAGAGGGRAACGGRVWAALGRAARGPLLGGAALLAAHALLLLLTLCLCLRAQPRAAHKA